MQNSTPTDAPAYAPREHMQLTRTLAGRQRHALDDEVRATLAAWLAPRRARWTPPRQRAWASSVAKDSMFVRPKAPSST